MREFLHGAGIVCLYYVIAASSIFAVRWLTKIPNELFRKILHFILLISYIPFAFAYDKWWHSVLLTLLLEIIIYPILKLAEHLPMFSSFVNERKGGEFKHSLLLPYPFLDARNNSDSCRRYTDTPMWNSSLSHRIGPMTKVDASAPDYVWYSPVEAESFDGLPPAYIETAEFDCLHDDGILYAELLGKAGIEVTLNETKGTMHGFDIATKAPTTLEAMEQRIAFMKRYMKRLTA